MSTNQVKPFASVLLFSICLLGMLASCKSDEIVNTSTQITTPFTGITKTNIAGNILSIDASDWKEFSIGKLKYLPQPVRPNPCTSDTGFVFQWLQQSRDSVIITLNDSPSHIMATLVAQKLDSGAYAVQGNVKAFQPAIYRLFFKIVRPESTYTTYGDVQIN